MSEAYAISIALGLLAFSAPVTAALIRNGRARRNTVTFEQCTAFREGMRELWNADLARIEERIESLREILESGLARIEETSTRRRRK